MDVVTQGSVLKTKNASCDESDRNCKVCVPAPVHRRERLFFGCKPWRKVSLYYKKSESCVCVRAQCTHCLVLPPPLQCIHNDPSRRGASALRSFYSPIHPLPNAWPTSRESRCERAGPRLVRVKRCARSQGHGAAAVYGSDAFTTRRVYRVAPRGVAALLVGPRGVGPTRVVPP